jgi:hypothetical protein
MKKLMLHQEKTNILFITDRSFLLQSQALPTILRLLVDLSTGQSDDV